MTDQMDFRNIEAALSEVRRLTTSKAEADALIAASLMNLAEAKEKLASIRAEAKTPENAEYVKAAKKAWQASIKAHELSIVAFKGDIAAYDAEIATILNRVPEARLDN